MGIAFTRQFPALPRVVIFLSVRIVPVAYISLEDRYNVTKVRSIPGMRSINLRSLRHLNFSAGLYGVTYRLGFRDSFHPDTADIIRLICALETRSDPRSAASVLAEIQSAAICSSHMYVHHFPSGVS